MQNNIQDNLIINNNLSSNIINPTPIIAIDGTSSSGKGTIAYMLSKHFSYNYLNSGALYRISAYLAKKQGISLDNLSEENLSKIVEIFISNFDNIIFNNKEVLHGGKDIWPIISSQECGNDAAKVSFYVPLRESIKSFQRNKIKMPGLVAEGRDMTSNVFIDAKVKIYLDATPEVRARRRLKDEEEKGSKKTFEILVEELKNRDTTDKNHKVGALVLTEDSFFIDTSNLNREEVFELAKNYCEKILNK